MRALLSAPARRVRQLDMSELGAGHALALFAEWEYATFRKLEQYHCSMLVPVSIRIDGRRVGRLNHTKIIARAHALARVCLSPACVLVSSFLSLSDQPYRASWDSEAPKYRGRLFGIGEGCSRGVRHCRTIQARRTMLG